MSNVTAFFRKQLPKSEPFEYQGQTPEQTDAFIKLKKLYDSKGRNNSTLSKDGDDSETIKS
ncbi:hypothetical protein GCM10023315_30700 [Algibacter aquimarinus]|uniref:Uncharacterized protein n=1 Tax=Algibacter aquimarinus TaxID=1136748 RepID=A0ABP9HSP3_9FLAO